MPWVDRQQERQKIAQKEGNPHVHDSASRHARASIFSKWLVERFGRSGSPLPRPLSPPLPPLSWLHEVHTHLTWVEAPDRKCRGAVQGSCQAEHYVELHTCGATQKSAELPAFAEPEVAAW